MHTLNFFEVLAILACVLGALLQYAVHRSPDIVDTRSSVTVARRITIVALVVSALYIVGSKTPLPPMTVLIMGLFGMGQMLYAAHNLKLDYA